MEGFIKAYKQLINTHKESISERIANGSCESHEEYKGLCGEVRGLEESLRYLSEAVRIYIDEEDTQ